MPKLVVDMAKLKTLFENNVSVAEMVERTDHLRYESMEDCKRLELLAKPYEGFVLAT